MLRLRQTGEASLGVTAVRVMAGIILLVAGTQKWAAGIDGFIGFVTQLGIPAPQLVGPVIAAGEVIGGLLVLLGFGARWVGLWFLCEFLVTSFYVKLGRGAGWDAARIDLMLLATSVMLLAAGAGAYALDEWLARRGQPGLHASRATSAR
jgi:putative oxidoreductase